MRPFIILLGIVCFVNTTYIAGQTPAFPGAEGFGANATGGRGGQVIYVTNLNCNGPGSLNEALAVPGAKYILFKVSGVIQCAAQVLYGDVTLAGQTSPGGIIVRGLVVDEIYEPEGTGNNIIVRHLRSRPQNPDTYPGTGWILDDGLRLDGAQDIIVDHCSFANALDEATQISNSQNISIQYCQLAETIGYHYIYGGMLINYSEPDHPQQNISIHHNVWNRIGGRFPEISCESPYCNAYPLNIELSNNLLWDINTTLWYGANIDPSGEDYSFFVHLIFIKGEIIEPRFVLLVLVVVWSSFTLTPPVFLPSFVNNPELARLLSVFQAADYRPVTQRYSREYYFVLGRVMKLTVPPASMIAL